MSIAAFSRAEARIPSLRAADHARRRELRIIDLLFAGAFGSLMLDFVPKAGSVKLPPTIAFAAIIGLYFLPRMFEKRNVVLFFSPALVAYFSVFLMSALAFSEKMWAVKTIEIITMLMVVWPFVIHYSEYPMDGFRKLFVMATAAVAVYCGVWHISHGYIVGWKRLNEPKIAFDLMPLIAVGIALAAPERRVRNTLVFLALALLVIISGERKAYVLLAFAAPVVFPPNRASSYFLPALVIVAVAGVGSLDSSGYLGRQFNSMQARANGQYADTLSDQQRQWTEGLARQQFADHPLFGIGTGGFRELLDTRYLSKVAAGEALNIHGEFTRVSAENGAVGLIAFLGLIVASLLSAIRPVDIMGRPRGLRERGFALMLVASIVVYMSVEAFHTAGVFALCLMSYVGRVRFDPSDRGAVQPARAARARVLAAIR